ncbi:hypothetical protein OOJ91_33850 [Micromonospora lupini]|uniref:hypothetical protein n=1 Tax=Micromonospora lupini TaxID=285679 RepID=UPI002259D9DC|nr:hypothetical protein [Micromonospora lupini]MCX5070832.1 hypothetical protein [Micromonospora lupini]
MTWRYIAARALTGEILDWDLPLNRDELTWGLSRSGSLRGTIKPDVGQLRAGDGRLLLEEWGTMLYAEADQQIRWAGIVVSSGFEGAQWRIEAAGVSAYPHGIPYLGEWRPVTVDPAAAIRHVWDHLQTFANGDLGVQVVGDTPVRIGTTQEPYQLSWWDATDCGREIEQLAREAPLEWVEEAAWSSPGSTAVTHTLRLGYPRLGRRRSDLAFVQGDNVTGVVPVLRSGDDYANEVVGLGAGEGRKMVFSRLPVIDGRLRRVAVRSDKSVTAASRMDALCRDDLTARQGLPEIAEIEVDDHPNAVLGSWAPGDDILVQATVPWLGDVSIWSRVIGWSLTGEHRARVALMRSDRFVYGGSA